MTALGIPYSVSEGADLAVTVGGEAIAGDFAGEPAAAKAALQAELEARGYDFERQTPAIGNIVGIIALLCALGMLSALTYGSVAALLTEMFPAKIRYSSMSIPYHIGAGYLGGFLPLIAGIIVARSGDVYAGLWYTIAVVGFGIVVAWRGLPAGPPRDFEASRAGGRDSPALP